MAFLLPSHSSLMLFSIWVHEYLVIIQYVPLRLVCPQCLSSRTVSAYKTVICYFQFLNFLFSQFCTGKVISWDDLDVNSIILLCLNHQKRNAFPVNTYTRILPRESPFCLHQIFLSHDSYPLIQLWKRYNCASKVPTYTSILLSLTFLHQ